MSKHNTAKELEKAGYYAAGKNKQARISIINKVTTKPQRLQIVEKLFTAKKKIARK
jgi:hypothetical protein